MYSVTAPQLPEYNAPLLFTWDPAWDWLYPESPVYSVTPPQLLE